MGEFHDGRGELYQSDTFHDKSILVRAVWSEITPNSHRYTESFSNDGGKTWFLSFDAHKTREKDLPPSDMAAGRADERRSRWACVRLRSGGTWHAQSSRLMHPLTGSTTWADLEGQTVVHRVWGGRANLAEYVGDGPAGHVQLLALRWFNPNTHEWNLDFATPNVGTLGDSPEWGSVRMAVANFMTRKSSTADKSGFDFPSGKSVKIPRNPNRRFPMMAERPGR